MKRPSKRPDNAAGQETCGDRALEWSTLVNCDEAPECSRNPVLRTGYRQQMSVSECFASVFMLHNETMNIWTHLVGGLGFIALLWSEVSAGTTAATSYRACYCAVTGTCFLGSALFHVLACNPAWYATAWIVDLAGMFALIGAGAGSMTYFSVGTSHGAWVYIHTGLCVGCSVLGFTLMASMVARQASSTGTADEAALRGILPALLVCLSFSYWLIAAVHIGFLEDFTTAWQCIVQLGPEWFSWGSGMLFIWKMRFPEVFVPYRFDFFGASHQLHHMVCVICACWHLHNAEQMHTWRPAGKMPALF